MQFFLRNAKASSAWKWKIVGNDDEERLTLLSVNRTRPMTLLQIETGGQVRYICSWINWINMHAAFQNDGYLVSSTHLSPCVFHEHNSTSSESSSCTVRDLYLYACIKAHDELPCRSCVKVQVVDCWGFSEFKTCTWGGVFHYANVNRRVCTHEPD